MSEKKYKVVDKYGHELANNMSLETALVLIKGYASEYYNEILALSILEEVEE